MRISDIKVARKPLRRSKAADVDAVESKYWFRFPDGYREYVTRLGEGILSDAGIRIYPPKRVDRELGRWRERIDRYWFWDAGRKVLPKGRALECIIVGDTVNGDEMVFHPARPGHLFLLPRDSARIFDAGLDIWSAIDWICSSGKIVEPVKDRNFEPSDARRESVPTRVPAASDPSGGSFSEIIKAADGYVRRHELVNALKPSKEWVEMLPSPLDNLPAKQLKLQLQRHLLVLWPKQDQSLRIVCTLTESNTGLEIGTLEFSHNPDSDGMDFSPNKPNMEKLKQVYGPGESFEDKVARVWKEAEAEGKQW